MNLQPIEKMIDGEYVDIVDIFYTIQGEGPWSGLASTFIRLGGCTLRCTSCDTLYSINRTILSIEKVVELVKELKCRHVVLTGGEPFRQKISMELLETLSAEGYSIQVETSGSAWFDNWKSIPKNVLIVCSPKTGKLQPGILPFIDAYKYIVSWDGIGDDGLPDISPITGKPLILARPVANRTGEIPPIYVSPWDVGDEEINRRNRETATACCLGHGYRLSLQIHKLIGVE